MSKKTPKRSKKRSNKKKQSKENAIILVIFIVFIAVVAYLFYFAEFSESEGVVATVNGEEITLEELNWWYKVSVLPENEDFILKEDFLVISVIPQELISQKAEEEGIEVSEDDVEQLIGLFIIENGLALDEFEEDLNERGLTLEDIRRSFETRAVATKLFEKENIDMGDGSQISETSSKGLDEFINDLINQSEIEIFPEEINKLVLESFQETGDNECDGEPIVRLYTTSKCNSCKETGDRFAGFIRDFVRRDEIEAFHWSLDEGDDLLTKSEENGIPEEEVEIFKKYSPNKLVPLTVIGCEYKYIGKLTDKEGAELKEILKRIS